MSIGDSWLPLTKVFLLLKKAKLINLYNNSRHPRCAYMSHPQSICVTSPRGGFGLQRERTRTQIRMYRMLKGEGGREGGREIKIKNTTGGTGRPERERQRKTENPSARAESNTTIDRRVIIAAVC